MSEVVVTLKGDRQAPWVVIHGETPGEVAGMIQELNEGEIYGIIAEAAKELTENSLTMAQAVQNVQNAMPGSQVTGQYDNSNVGGYYGGGGQNLPQQFQPGGQPEMCAHGAMTYIANGKYGPFWGCPLPKGHPDKCRTKPAR